MSLHRSRRFALPCARFSVALLAGFVLMTPRGAGAAVDDLAWSTFLGGTGTDYGAAIAVAPGGDLIVVSTTTSADFPVTPGAFQSVKGLDRDVVVTRMRADGSTVVWSTFLGGAGADNGLAVAVDGSGVYVAGTTSSPDFPTSSGAHRRAFAGGASDAFVAKLALDGSRLIFGTYLGGAANDLGLDLAVDATGAVVVAGYTGSTDFPTTPGAVKTTRAGGLLDSADGFVTRLDPAGATLVWSTYVGAEGGTDEVLSLALDAQGRAVVAGMTQSPNFPTTSGAFARGYVAYWDGFVARLSANGAAFEFSTLLPGGGYDEPQSVAVGAQGTIHVAGRTNSVNFPTTSGAPQRTYGGGSYDGFVCALDPTGAVLRFGTYLGGGGADQAFAVAAGPDGGAVVAGFSDAANYPVTAGAFDVTANGGTDVFVTRATETGGTLAYSTWLGAAGAELGRAVAVLDDGTVAVAGYSTSAGFPTTASAYDPTLNGTGTYDGFVARLDVGWSTTVGVAPVAPAGLALHAPRPNPSQGDAHLTLALDHDQPVRVRILDVRGRVVRELHAGALGAGTHVIRWDGRDAGGALRRAEVLVVEAVTSAGRRTTRLVRR